MRRSSRAQPRGYSRSVIYLHCGWPKTGTTSLQAAIARNRDRLAATGTVFPDRWGLNGDDTHNEIASRLAAAQAGQVDSVFGDVASLLARHAVEDVLLSSESLSGWLLDEERCEILLALLHTMQQTAPVTCVWTLRRFDDAAHSLYVQLSLARSRKRPPIAFMERLSQDGIFSSMRKVEDAIDGRVIYVKYDPIGAHNAELLRAFGVAEDLAEVIQSDLRASPRLNISRTHKQLAAAINADELSARSGATLDKHALLEVFDRGEFTFEDDWPCELIGYDVRRGLHERALKAAREHSFTPYIRFFADEELGELPMPESLELDILSDRDLERLTSYLAHSRGGGLSRLRA